MFKKSLFAAALLMAAAMPASAQDIATRIFNIENQMRLLTGQMEELNHSMQLLQKQLGNTQSGGLEQPLEKKPQLKKLADVPIADEGIEAIEDPAAVQTPKKQAIILGSENGDISADLAPAPTTLGSGQNNSAANSDTAGQVLVPEQDVAAAVTQPVVTDGVQQEDSIEQVSLTPQAETPESSYERWYEALLRRQFSEAETGFRAFLDKYPEHNLAGSAQYQLGETFYAQNDFRGAAQNYLEGYKKYPKSRRAPDSLLKLGMSLKKLGQKDQACAALGSVATEFPRAVEAKKRAQAEYKRGGC